MRAEDSRLSSVYLSTLKEPTVLDTQELEPARQICISEFNKERLFRKDKFDVMLQYKKDQIEIRDFASSSAYGLSTSSNSNQFLGIEMNFDGSVIWASVQDFDTIFRFEVDGMSSFVGKQIYVCFDDSRFESRYSILYATDFIFS